MNNFTKEELEKIFYYVDITSHIQDDDEQQLLNKIQSMIDSYCEHGLLKNLVCLECTRNPEKYRNE
ncbi:TPA: hypothetical protein NQN30_000377 [Legionella pneumophila]|nr:hypothetical protein [Legionella pneumophila]